MTTETETNGITEAKCYDAVFEDERRGYGMQGMHLWTWKRQDTDFPLEPPDEGRPCYTLPLFQWN